MANPTATVTEYCGVLARSRLLTADEVATQINEWRASAAGTDADVDAFRKFLVGRNRLTEYQAALVQRGHADGFFIGGYVILDRIGRGQTAGVYKAVHTSGQTVAVKVLPASKAKSPNLLARFQREGRLLTQLNHPNVVRAFQLGSAGGVHFIAMEYLEGETLDEVLARRGKLPPPEAVRLVRQALQGLQHLHERRMVHRDLKPANLMATPARPDTTLAATVKILDIGLGRELFDEAGSDTHDLDLTAEGTILGTPDYLAPEQARDARGADIRADVYSLGCVLYHLLAGRPPFAEKNVMATVVKHATEAVPPLGPGVPPGLQAVLHKMMAKDPAARYQVPSDAADALMPFLPSHAAAATETVVLPAFEQWLGSEASREQQATMTLPAAAPPRPNGSGAVRIGPARAADPAGPQSGKIPRPPGLSGPPAGKIPRPSTIAPQPAATAGPMSGKIPRPPGMGGSSVAGPVSGKIPRPPGMAVIPPAAGKVAGPPSGKIKVGTGLAAALAGATPAATAAPPLKPPSVPGRPSPLPPAAAPPDIDVELIALPGVRLPESVDMLDRVVATPPPRPLWDLDRRDFLMMAAGAGLTLTAIVAGLTLAKTNTNRLRGGEQDKKANQPDSE